MLGSAKERLKEKFRRRSRNSESTETASNQSRGISSRSTDIIEDEDSHHSSYPAYDAEGDAHMVHEAEFASAHHSGSHGGNSGSNVNPSNNPDSSDNTNDEDDNRMVFTSDDQLYIEGEYELAAYNILKTRSFEHTCAFDNDFMEKTGMNNDFENVWHAVGWSDFAHIPEQGCRLLTIQFLCTLKTGEEGISFCFPRDEYSLSWKDLSIYLGFHKKCLLI